MQAFTVFFSYHSFNFHSHNSIFQTMALKQVPIRISPEAHAKATADAQAQGKTIAKHLSDIVDAMLLAPPAPAVPYLKADDWNHPENDHWDELDKQPAPAETQDKKVNSETEELYLSLELDKKEAPETKVVAEPAQAPYVFQGI